MKMSILTICPESFESFLKSHVIDRAVKLGLLEVNIVDIRDFAAGSFRKVDDSPFGGGRGLLLRCEPVLNALESVAPDYQTDCSGGSFAEEHTKPEVRKTRVFALAPAGVTFNQKMAHECALSDHIVLICGHYEGMDARIYNHVDERVSIGDYVLSGGEVAAQVIMDAVARLLPGNLKAGSAEDESFEEDGGLEYLQYTKPADYKGEKVPDVLLSGHHGKIAEWRRKSAEEETKKFKGQAYT